VGVGFSLTGGGRAGLVGADGGQWLANHAVITCIGDVEYTGEGFVYAERPGSMVTIGRTTFPGCENMKGRKCLGLGLALIDTLEGGRDFYPVTVPATCRPARSTGKPRVPSL